MNPRLVQSVRSQIADQVESMERRFGSLIPISMTSSMPEDEILDNVYKTAQCVNIR